MYQGVRNVRFSENLMCFVFLKHPFRDLPFCLITDELLVETMKSNLNEEVSNLTEEVQKLNTNFELLKSDFSATRIENNSLNERLIALERQRCANAQYSRWECLEITSIPSSISDKDFEKVVCKVIPKAEVDITADDIEHCHRVGNKSQTLIKFGNRKVSRKVLSVRKDLNKIKMSDIEITGQSTLYINQSLCPYYRMLWSKTKTLYQKGKIDSFYVSNGNIKIRLQENARPITISHTHDFIKYFPGVDLSVVM